MFKGTLASRNYDCTAETPWSDISGVTATDITPLCNAYTAPATDTPNATAEYEVILVPQTVAANGAKIELDDSAASCNGDVTVKKLTE